ncbi:50S ribosomal protein L21 [Spiroplasma citri]|uniref:Large ribosomal subunit protein bL21 n=1 Tax=Spiroplasma citri TaxID=2133 RepID=A0AAJ4EIS8_SPICI|nr:50S ribosomal protein L21 [Spiroplasma citri]QED24345.1 50S ribosomal protein L21 [Spiroplasma citri]QIA68493.1 50S ribosomal protein L21 [Spiroplasma citri]QIA70369.1 50S ribosomal protein L21 [Spiroplasma citri]QIA72605.1 50S ribosomal protein L21 [Spiroplasma citri]
MFAIIKTGGKQLRVSQGDEIFVEMLNGNEGEKVNFTEILMIDGEVGTPFIKGASVTGTILKQGKQKKIVVFHYKPKKTQHKKYGHRQPYTKVKIDQILLSSSAKETTTDAKTKPVVAKTTTAAKSTVKPVADKKPVAAKPAAKSSSTTSAKKPASKTKQSDK